MLGNWRDRKLSQAGTQARELAGQEASLAELDGCKACRAGTGWKASAWLWVLAGFLPFSMLIHGHLSSMVDFCGVCGVVTYL